MPYWKSFLVIPQRIFLHLKWHWRWEVWDQVWILLCPSLNQIRRLCEVFSRGPRQWSLHWRYERGKSEFTWEVSIKYTYMKFKLNCDYWVIMIADFYQLLFLNLREAIILITNHKARSLVYNICHYKKCTGILISMYHWPVTSQIWFSQEFTQQHSVCHVFDHGSLRCTVFKSDTVANLW